MVGITIACSNPYLLHSSSIKPKTALCTAYITVTQLVHTKTASKLAALINNIMIIIAVITGLRLIFEVAQKVRETASYTQDKVCSL